MAGKSKPNELNIIRVYDAPVKLVWEVFTDPKHAQHWWGPRGFTITNHSKELKPGGHWHYIMHGPDGQDWVNKTKYLEVDKYKRLVYDHGGNDEQAPLFRVTVLFSEHKGKTTMDMTMSVATAEVATEMKKFIKKAGGNSTWDRLAEYLAQESGGKEQFVINRSFAAPVEKIFAAWTDPLQLGRWLPPTGFTMKFERADIRPGGDAFYSMTNGQVTFYGRSNYVEIERPKRLVYTQQFCDANGQVSRHPGAPLWPETMQTTVDFVEENPGETRVTVTWEPKGAVTKAELEAFLKERGGMTQGWTGSFDKLDEVLGLPVGW